MSNFKPHTLFVFPAGYNGELGFFEADKSIHVTNTAESRRVIRGRTIPKYVLVGLTIVELNPELRATIQICGFSIASESGVQQQFEEIELNEVQKAKVIKPNGKRDILHLTFDRELGLTDADILQVQALFKTALEDPSGAIITTIDGISADVLNISEGAEIRLVSAHIKDDVIYEILEQDKSPCHMVLAGESDELPEQVGNLNYAPTPGIVERDGKYFRVEDTGRVDSPFSEISFEEAQEAGAVVTRVDIQE